MKIDDINTVLDILSCPTFQCALETQYWTWINHFFTWGSIILFMLIQVILYADKLTFMDFFYEYMGVTPQACYNSSVPPCTQFDTCMSFGTYDPSPVTSTLPMPPQPYLWHPIPCLPLVAPRHSNYVKLGVALVT